MKRQLLLVLTALSFYTRCPVPKFVHQNDGHLLPDAIRYLPVVGWIVGGICGLVYFACSYLLGSAIGVLSALAAGILFTGAFHEDGFADVCDGFGGGYTKERVLGIMKDSHLGTYGVVGLLLLIGMKGVALYQLLFGLGSSLSLITVILLFIVAHSLSRCAAITLIFKYSYVRIAESKVSGALEAKLKNLVLAAVFTLVPLVLLMLQTNILLLGVVIIPVLMVAFFAGKYFNARIGGYTGDCLGAVQQLSEVTIYLSYILIWKFI